MHDAVAEPHPHIPDVVTKARPLPAIVGRALEPVYRAAIARINRRFDRGLGITRFDLPVISVGNLSVGGTGKSPMVMHIVSELLRAHLRPCIAMRGYRKRGRVPARHPDETDAYQRHFPAVPIVAQPDRIAGLRALLAQHNSRPDCIVLDDGFQRRRIARDIDIVLIDASRSPFNDHLLPYGWLREPVDSLARATMVVLTHAELIHARQLIILSESLASRRSGIGFDAIARHAWTGLRLAAHNSTDHDHPVSLDWLLGKRIVASCAIGNPAGFLHSLNATLAVDSRRAGELVGTLVLPDHDPFDRETVRVLSEIAHEREADAIVVTDKDWSKLRHVPAEIWRGRPIVRPDLSLVFDRGLDEFNRTIVQTVEHRAAQRA